ncbi:MAG: nucleotidyltransferase family protein [Clostridia bacterium]|nr:nucleotidyltransferase family protein [Clostridia bacterium]
MSDTAMDLVYLAVCAVNGKAPERARVESMDLDAVYSAASRHMITSAVAFALEAAGYKDSRSAGAIGAAMRKEALFDQAWSAVREQLEKAGIWYMPLKGAVLKTMYPKYGMREFADHDILIDPARAEDVRAVMEAQGYHIEHFGAGVHDSYHRQPCLSFEMHRALFGPMHAQNLYDYYKDVETRLIAGEGFERRFSPEDFYLYIVAHENKHFEGGGTGLRSLMDTYLYLKKVPLNMAYVAAEAEKLGIGGFERQNRALAEHLFGGEALTEADQEMLHYILSSGTYGTILHHVQNKTKRNGGSKLKYVLSRFSVPFSRKNKRYESFAAYYPLFYRHRILLPFLPFYRVCKGIKKGRVQAEMQAVRKA